ncbi:MAG: redox-sensing transcriptional repressor Rex [Chthoniobacterales bacterium]
MKEIIPRKTVYRLSVYHRCLERMVAGEDGRVSSDTLAKIAGVKPTQLRKDLACFGHFGKRGIGYDAQTLRARLSEVLGTTRLQPVILIGAGNLGMALLGYQGFAKEGFEIIGAFDAQPERVDMKAPGIPVFSMEELQPFIKKNNVKMAILAVPGHVAQEVCNQLVEVGVQAVLNFAPIILQVPEHTVVNNVNLAIELENLSYFIR